MYVSFTKNNCRIWLKKMNTLNSNDWWWSTCQQACWCFVDSHSPSVSREGLVPRTTWWNDEMRPWLEWLKSGLGFLRSKSVSLGHSNDQLEACFRNPRVFGEDFWVVLFWKGKNKTNFPKHVMLDEIVWFPSSQLPRFFSNRGLLMVTNNPNNRLMNAPSKLPGPSSASSSILQKDGYMIPWSPLKRDQLFFLFSAPKRNSQVLNLFSSL